MERYHCPEARTQTRELEGRVLDLFSCKREPVAIAGDIMKLKINPQ